MDVDENGFPQGALMQRARGEAVVSFQNNKLTDLRQSGCLKVMLPRNHAPIPDVVLINTAGGVTGGDKLSSQIEIGTSSAARIATQTAERFYRSSENAEPGEIATSVKVGINATVQWLPQECILFDGSKTSRQTHFSVHGTSAVVAVDAWVFGRVAMGEALSKVELSDTRKLLVDGKLRLFDRLNFQHAERLSNPFALGANKAIASVWIYRQHVSEQLDQARALSADGSGRFSVVNGCLVGRFAAEEPRVLRAELMTWLQQFLKGDLPRVWTM